jgi:predicted transcriptional regulator
MAPRSPRADALPRPTDAELAILAALWRLERATVREVHEALAQFQDESTGYTTTLKLLQIMHGKGLVTRDDAQRAHVYAPAQSKQLTQEQMLGDLSRRVFDGSPAALALQALGTAKRAKPEELAQIRELLDGLAPADAKRR